MRNRLLLFAILFFATISLYAQTRDTLSTILSSNIEENVKKQQLVSLFYRRFLISSAYDAQITSMGDSLRKYKVSGALELVYFGKALALRRKYELEKADQLLTKAIDFAQLNHQDVFLYQFQLNQAYIQTDMGNPLRAVHNYRLARKTAEKLENDDFLVTTEIGISDIYMNSGLYQQALMYLNQVQATLNSKEDVSMSTQSLVYLNKAEVFFKLGALDSLRRYAKLAFPPGQNAKISRSEKRLCYYIMLLAKDYKNAIAVIKELQQTPVKYYSTVDSWHLAEAYYHTHALVLARIEAERLIGQKHFSANVIKIQTYELLAQISEDEGDLKGANRFNKLALKESQVYSDKMIGIGDLSSELRLDRLESTYTAKDMIYRKERIILAFAAIAASLVGVVIFLFYRSIRQKNKYQQLLHQTKSRELAFIHSHQIRKPLANILGICSLINDTKPKGEELETYNLYLYKEAKEIDESLKEIEAKLRD